MATSMKKKNNIKKKRITKKAKCDDLGNSQIKKLRKYEKSWRKWCVLTSLMNIYIYIYIYIYISIYVESLIKCYYDVA